MGTDTPRPRVVVGVDGSPSSHAALRWAVRYADPIGGTVDAVVAWDMPGAYGWAALAVDIDFDEAVSLQRLSQELSDVLGAEGASSVRGLAVRGNTVEALLTAAEVAEVLVVGSRGRGGFARALLGSVSQHVAAHARCPVAIVRPESRGGQTGTPV